MARILIRMEQPDLWTPSEIDLVNTLLKTNYMIFSKSSLELVEYTILDDVLWQLFVDEFFQDLEEKAEYNATARKSVGKKDDDFFVKGISLCFLQSSRKNVPF